MRGSVPYPSAATQWTTLAILVVAFLVSYVDRQLLALLVAPISADLGLREVQMSLLIGLAFALFYASFGIPTGRLADSLNRKWLIVAGVTLWSMATLLSGLAQSFTMLFLCRMLVGVGEAALAPASYSIVGDLFPPRRLVRATSILALAANLSVGLALIVGGQVIVLSGRDLAWPLGMGALAPWQRSFILVALPGFAVALLMLAIREPERRSRPANSPHESSSRFLLLWRRRKEYAPLYGAGAGMSVIMWAGLVWFPTHLMRTFGMTPAVAGAALGTVQVVGSIVGTALGVWLTERQLARGRDDAHVRTVAYTSALAALALVAVFMKTPWLSLAFWFVGVVLQTTYYGNISAALQIVTPAHARGSNIALLYLIINIFGLSLGSALIGALAQYVFPGMPRGIGFGIAIVGGLGALGASLSCWLGLGAYGEAARREVALAEARDGEVDVTVIEGTAQGGAV